MRRRRLRIFLWLFGGLIAIALIVLANNTCLTGYVRYGTLTGECPDGTPRAGVEIDANGLRRGTKGYVSVAVPVRYTTGPADEARLAYSRRFTPKLTLVRKGASWPLAPEKGWEDRGARRAGVITLPEGLEDGVYGLRADVETPLGAAHHQIDLPIFAPAKVHTITDRPLYEPGHTVRFRAVVLRARDLSPLEGRPGRFLVKDPSGEVVYEAKAPAGPFGVASSDFPLDEAAPTGVWWVVYETGEARSTRSIRVEPFSLPRFTVEASASAPFYRVSDAPVVRGRVVYSSGAPVSGAHLELSWSSSGAWPPPTAWMQGELPTSVYVEDDGRFELRLPRVPGDLVGQATLHAAITAVDPAGDRVSGSAHVLLSKDAIAASAVTELQGGLAPGFNNRVYVRVTSADGRPLPATDLVVRRAWDPTDEGKPARTDADGVAALQVDPGPAVNVLVPAPPVRPPPRPAKVVRLAGRDLAEDAPLSLAYQAKLDAQQAKLAPCARFVDSGSEQVQVGLRLNGAGRVVSVTAEPGALPRCVARVASDFAFSPGVPRVLELSWRLTEDEPSLAVELDGTPVVPDALRAALGEAALDARRCLPEDAPSADLSEGLVWTLEPGATKPSVEVVSSSRRSPLAPSALRCVTDTLRRARLEAPWGEAAPRSIGVARLSLEAGPRYEASSAPDTMKLGYELEIAAAAGEEAIGRTKLFLPPGRVPDLRLRATPVLAAPGQEVEVKLLRGPSFTGTLPEKLYWRHEGTSHDMKLDEKTRTARFTVPDGASGWFEVEHGGGRALVFVRPAAELQVDLTSDREVYAPGAVAKLTVRTRAAGSGTPAAVGLFGVDQTLAQLAPLPGADDMANLRPKVQMGGLAFGALDAQALTLGRVQGAAAAAAIVTRVRSVPAPEALDNYVSAQGMSHFEPVEALTDGFYRVLGHLYEAVRRWEAEAPEDARMRPATMAELWQVALTEAAKGEAPVTDAYGRPLRLSVLPDDLLALADPRAVVVDGTRLPEDVDNWIAWVRKEKP